MCKKPIYEGSRWWHDPYFHSWPFITLVQHYRSLHCVCSNIGFKGWERGVGGGGKGGLIFFRNRVNEGKWEIAYIFISFLFMCVSATPHSPLTCMSPTSNLPGTLNIHNRFRRGSLMVMDRHGESWIVMKSHG